MAQNRPNFDNRIIKNPLLTNVDQSSIFEEIAQNPILVPASARLDRPDGPKRNEGIVQEGGQVKPLSGSENQEFTDIPLTGDKPPVQSGPPPLTGFSRPQNLSRYPTNTSSLLSTIPTNVSLFTPFTAEQPKQNPVIFTPGMLRSSPVSLQPDVNRSVSPGVQQRMPSSLSYDNISNPSVLNPNLTSSSSVPSNLVGFQPIQNSSTNTSLSSRDQSPSLIQNVQQTLPSSYASVGQPSGNSWSFAPQNQVSQASIFQPMPNQTQQMFSQVQTSSCPPTIASSPGNALISNQTTMFSPGPPTMASPAMPPVSSPTPQMFSPHNFSDKLISGPPIAASPVMPPASSQTPQLFSPLSDKLNSGPPAVATSPAMAPVSSSAMAPVSSQTPQMFSPQNFSDKLISGSPTIASNPVMPPIPSQTPQMFSPQNFSDKLISGPPIIAASPVMPPVSSQTPQLFSPLSDKINSGPPAVATSPAMAPVSSQAQPMFLPPQSQLPSCPSTISTSPAMAPISNQTSQMFLPPQSDTSCPSTVATSPTMVPNIALEPKISSPDQNVFPQSSQALISSPPASSITSNIKTASPVNFSPPPPSSTHPYQKPGLGSSPYPSALQKRPSNQTQSQIAPQLAPNSSIFFCTQPTSSGYGAPVPSITTQPIQSSAPLFQGFAPNPAATTVSDTFPAFVPQNNPTSSVVQTQQTQSLNPVLPGFASTPSVPVSLNSQFTEFNPNQNVKPEISEAKTTHNEPNILKEQAPTNFFNQPQTQNLQSQNVDPPSAQSFFRSIPNAPQDSFVINHAPSAPFSSGNITSSPPNTGFNQNTSVLNSSTNVASFPPAENISSSSENTVSNSFFSQPTVSYPPSGFSTARTMFTSVAPTSPDVSLTTPVASSMPDSINPPSVSQYFQTKDSNTEPPVFSFPLPSSSTDPSKPPLFQPQLPLQSIPPPPKGKAPSHTPPPAYNSLGFSETGQKNIETDTPNQGAIVDDDGLEQIPLQDTVSFFNPDNLNIQKSAPKKAETGNTFRLKTGLKRPTYAPVPDLEVAHHNIEPLVQNSQTQNNETNENIVEKSEPDNMASPESISRLSSRSSTTSPPGESVEFATASTGPTYRPPYHHWFYKKGTESKAVWQPFSMADSLNLEQAFTSNDINQETKVATDGGRYDVEVLTRKKIAVYWEEPDSEVRRCSWFVKMPIDGRYIPYDENLAEILEDAYRTGCMRNEWNKRVELADGEVIILHSPNAMAHHQRSSSPDTWGNAPPMQQKPRIVKRGLEDFEISEGEPNQVDHLLLVVHGIGKVCDLRFRSLVQVVDDFRVISLQLIQSHFKSASECGNVGRVEMLPVEWHRALHTEAIDQRLADITLPSIPRAREFTNETLLDILFYTSPIFCEKIVQAVGAELNRVYNLYIERNPNFKGGVSIAGHSLGSLILFDMLSNQKTSIRSPITTQSSIPEDEDITDLGFCKTKARLSRRMSYLTIGSAGTGQPFISYPQLSFQPQAFFAFGSPIGMFITVRGIESLGEDFKFPTCPRFFNIFHPNDPVAYRIEALVCSEMAKVPAVMIPHHKGRKRMHLELKDTMAHVTAALKQKLVDSVRSTWNTVYQLAMFQRPDSALQQEVDKALEDEVLRGADVVSPTNSFQLALNEEQGLELRVGALNEGNRIDFVLQEAPLETFNQYISAVSSHVVYWESEDTMLLVLKEIYKTMGISSDSQVPQQILPFDIGSEDNFTEYTDSSYGAPRTTFVRK